MAQPLHPLALAAASAPLAAPEVLPAALGLRPLPPADAAGSRRRRLWELEGHAHCPVIGMCLPLAALRRLVGRLCVGPVTDDDYELHCLVVAECKRRTPLAEALHKELDRRFAQPLREASKLKTPEALARWWDSASQGQAVPGVFWAAITHARCDTVLEHRLLGEVHMLQHQVGMATRADLARLESLLHENAVLTRALAAAQQRSQRQADEHARRAAQDAQALAAGRAEAAMHAGQAAQLREHLHALEDRLPDLPGRLDLQRDRDALAEQARLLQRSLFQAREEADRQRRRALALEAELAQARSQPAEAAPPTPAANALQDRSVLCVGGRPAVVPVYRRLVEDTGGRFLHHDGGEEDHIAQLDATLAAADLVICQTGCVSHDAYWRVKDHCKRTGKRCVFVETPSRAALLRALDQAMQPQATR